MNPSKTREIGFHVVTSTLSISVFDMSKNVEKSFILDIVGKVFSARMKIIRQQHTKNSGTSEFFFTICRLSQNIFRKSWDKNQLYYFGAALWAELMTWHYDYLLSQDCNYLIWWFYLPFYLVIFLVVYIHLSLVAGGRKVGKEFMIYYSWNEVLKCLYGCLIV